MPANEAKPETPQPILMSARCLILCAPVPLITFIIDYFAVYNVADVGKVGIVEKNSSKNRVSSADACFEC